MTTRFHISRRQFGMAMASTGLLGLGGPAVAADFPNKPIKIVVPWAAGGGGDVVIRMLAPAISERLNTPVFVENRGGATGTIGSAVVAKSPGDGYTLVYGTADSHSIMPHLQKLPYDARKDFTAIAPIGFFPYALGVHPSVPARTVQEFVQFARAAKDKVTYGSWGVGSSGQVLAESFKGAAGVDMMHVPYQGTAPLMVALIGGQVQAAVLPMPLVEQHAKSGAIRLLAVATPERLPSFPGLPTLKEQGVPVDVGTWVGFLAPANVPADVVQRLHAAIQDAMSQPAMAEKLRQAHVLPDRMDPARYQAFLDREYERWGNVIRKARITLE